ETDIDSSADFEAALLAVTGESLETLLAEFEVHPVFSATDLYSVNRLQQDIACEDDDLPVVTSPGSWTHDLRCSSSTVEGRRGRWVRAQQKIELPEPGRYTFTPIVDRDLHYNLELRACAREGQASVYYIYSPRTLFANTPGNVEYPIEGELPAGTYVLRLFVDAELNEPGTLDDTLTIDIALAPTP
ncbi:MAG: hypothetical protein KC431_08695, partial [Myxococcales bacterium]|nr:hypothetical protein [Myxococcales bacterium]